MSSNGQDQRIVDYFNQYPRKKGTGIRFPFLENTYLRNGPRPKKCVRHSIKYVAK